MEILQWKEGLIGVPHEVCLECPYDVAYKAQNSLTIET